MRIMLHSKKEDMRHLLDAILEQGEQQKNMLPGLCNRALSGEAKEQSKRIP